MAKSMSDEAIAKGTGIPWDTWIEYFVNIDASNLSHADIARQLVEDHEVTGWWAQALTVVYEQEIGRRVPGQDCDGEYSVSVSKTLNHDLDDSLQWWLEAVDGRDEFADVPLTEAPEVSKTDKWRYWRARLRDGSRVQAHMYEKAPGKSSLTVMHEKLESTDQIEHWRSYWKAFLKNAAIPRMERR